ncbi:MAG: FG-GAP-like repeat-containing protein [Bacteroidota bacterium]
MKSVILFPIKYLLPLFIAALYCTTCLGQLGRENVNVIFDPPGAYRSTLADFDNDGDLDLLGSRWGGNGHLVYFELLDGQAKFARERIFGDTTWWGLPTVSTQFEVADMDNDGDLDIVCEAEAASAFPFWGNDGNANFTRPLGQTSPPIGNLIFRLGDFDQDGWQDVFFYQPAERQIAVNWNGGTGAPFVYMELPEVELPAHQGMKDILILDFDQDDDLDIALLYDKTSANGKSFHLSILEQTCETCFELGPELEIAAADDRFNFVQTAVADFNQDGWLDLSVSYSTYYSGNTTRTNTLMFLENQLGSGAFSVAASLPSYADHVAADVNQDGQVDLYAVYDDDLVHNPSSDDDLYAKHWLRNTGDFNFEVVPIDEIHTGTTVAAGDIDQDGLIDLISTGDYSSQARDWWNRLESTSGEWAAPVVLNDSPDFMSDFALTDWDTDGDLDLISTSFNYVADSVADALFWFENMDGLGNFAYPEQLINLPEEFEEAVFLDINADQRLDVIGKYIVGGRLQVFYLLTADDPAQYELHLLNAIDCAFTDPIGSSDLDGDNDPDLLLLQRNGNIAVLWNEIAEGNGLVESPDYLTPPEAGYRLHHQDVNQDDLADVLVYNNTVILWAKQESAGGIFSPWISLDPGPGILLGELLQGDFDGDGDLDLRYQLRGDDLTYSWVTVPFDQVSGTYVAPIPMELNTDFSQSLDTGLDLNNDGVDDMLGEQGFRLSIPGSNYALSPFVPTPVPDPMPYRYFGEPVLGNLDDDPEMELATVNLIWYDLDFIPEHAVQGLVVWDSTANCQFDSLLPPMVGWPVQVISEDQEQLILTNQDGHYGALLPASANEHLVQPLPPSPYWDTCPTDTLLIPPFENPTTVVHFTATANTLCPLLRVDLATTPIRQCFNSTVVVSYENVGTLAAQEVQISLSFDDRFTPVSSSIPWASITDTSLVFDLAEVPIGGSGSIILEFEPDCEALQLDEEVCFVAQISPNDLCNDDMALMWNGAQLQADASCEQDSVAFQLTNTGSGGMDQPQAYRVHIVNDDIVIFLEGEVQLNPDESVIVRVPRRDEDLRFSIDQPAGHPFPEAVRLLHQACDEVDNDPILSLPNMEGDPFSAQVCRSVIGPFDPNIKEAYPTGIGPGRLIERDWKLTYTIHFQNTGTDLARTVVLKDTLSPFLDLSTFQPVSSSHAYEWQILADRTLIVTYPDINLPDSTSNLVGSQGLFSYSIVPLAAAPALSLIENRAGIYFDFNPPIITNYTRHTIRKPRLEFVENITICAGETIQGIVMTQDTFLQELIEFDDWEEVYVTQIEVLSLAETIVPVGLDNPGLWQDIWISQDTTVIEYSIGANGCDSLTIFQIDVLTNTSDPAWQDDITLSPNPTTGPLTLTWPDEVYLQQIAIYNVNGQLLQKWTSRQQGQHQLMVHSLPEGAYYLLLQDENGNIARAPFTKINSE